MFGLIERYMSKLTKEDVLKFAISNNVNLSESELDFTYQFVKKNWQTILSNHGNFDIDRYKGNFSEENFTKIKKLIKEYATKYSRYI
ncbi:MAG: hypothetical protein ACI31M_00180 [Bacilli bacterium]